MQARKTETSWKAIADAILITASAYKLQLDNKGNAKAISEHPLITGGNDKYAAKPLQRTQDNNGGKDDCINV
ncbi:hypothetical protein GQX74_015476 [Glossina fuscipes]|nr:hypothetical protein GQX74_015476 [Glossina fuscipes]